MSTIKHISEDLILIKYDVLIFMILIFSTILEFYKKEFISACNH